MRNVPTFQPAIPGQWKTRPGMFGNKDNERGNGIHQPPWNPTALSLLKWEVSKQILSIKIYGIIRFYKTLFAGLRKTI